MDYGIEERLTRLEARAKVENLIGTYCHYLFAGEGKKIMETLWAGTETVSIEIGASGKYSSREKVSTYYEKDSVPGKFLLLLPVTPVIEVAGDGKSAKGLWFVLGMDSDAGEYSQIPVLDPERRKLFTSVTEEGKAYQAECSLWKLGADFVEEEGVWKILHLHQYDILRFPCGSDWVRFAEERFLTDGMRLDSYFKSNLPFAKDKPPENLASAPTAYHWQYRVDNVTENQPRPPKPYRTLSETEPF